MTGNSNSRCGWNRAGDIFHIPRRISSRISYKEIRALKTRKVPEVEGYPALGSPLLGPKPSWIGKELPTTLEEGHSGRRSTIGCFELINEAIPSPTAEFPHISRCNCTPCFEPKICKENSYAGDMIGYCKETGMIIRHYQTPQSDLMLDHRRIFRGIILLGKGNSPFIKAFLWYLIAYPCA